MSTETKHTAHADAGRTRLRKTFVEKPDTVIKLPEGRKMTLWAVWKLPPCREGMIRSHPLSVSEGTEGWPKKGTPMFRDALV